MWLSGTRSGMLALSSWLLLIIRLGVILVLRDILIMHVYAVHINSMAWACCQIRQIAGADAPGIPGMFSPPPRVSNPDMHHGTCVTHVPWCMPGSLTRGFLWITLWFLLALYGVATICHQVRGLRWGHPSLFHIATSLLIWYKIVCLRDISYRLIWLELINMFSVYAQSGTHSRFNW